METLFTLENLVNLSLLIMLQAVLGFDNLLYIAIESKRVEPRKQALVRKLGIGLAVLLRLVLLFAVMELITVFQDPVLTLDWQDIATGSFNLHSIIVLFGGVFILYTAMKEILHMMALEEIGHQQSRPRSFYSALFWIVVMNAIFSFDSILSALAFTDVFAVMATAIIIGGILMIWLADEVAAFLQKNRMFEVVGLFVLFLVGIMLVSEGGHLAQLTFAGYSIEPMGKATFYFVIAVVVLVNIVQTRYRRKLQLLKQDRAVADRRWL
jgi:predicted tellurium resistance membrane protein TerC